MKYLLRFLAPHPLVRLKTHILTCGTAVLLTAEAWPVSRSPGTWAALGLAWARSLSWNDGVQALNGSLEKLCPFAFPASLSRP